LLTYQKKKYIIDVDVETNGLIKDRNIEPDKSNLKYFPHIVQFSWGLYTEDGECKEVKDYIIKPTNWLVVKVSAFMALHRKMRWMKAFILKKYWRITKTI